ncbi:MAG: hypothetical protein IJO97_02375 [Lachnospiraceae bacterium]|nr:hypothetical protein [Lachnospiraceae bacterium]
MEQNEIQIPEIEEKQNQKKTWLVAAGILAACFIVVAVVIVAVIKIYNTDERKLLKGVTNLAKEVAECDEVWAKETDKSKTTTVLNVSAEEMPITIGIDVEALSDAEAKRMQTSMAVSVSNINLAEFIVYGDEQQMMIEMPDFWRQILVFETENIDEQYNNSRWLAEIGPIFEEEFSIDLFEEKDDETIEIDLERLIEGWKDFQKEGFTIEKLEKKIEIDVSAKNNMIYECDQYRVVIPQTMLKSIIKEEQGDTIVNDIVLLVAMDKNNKIVQVQLEEPMLLSTGVNEEIEFSGYVMFLGKERSIDDTVVRFKWNIPMEALELDKETREIIESFGNTDDSLDKIDIVTDMNMMFDENDMNVAIDLDELTMSVGWLGSYKMTGSVVVEPLQENIQPLEGETIQLFEMTDAEYADLTNQFWENLYKLAEAFESIY